MLPERAYAQAKRIVLTGGAVIMGTLLVLVMGYVAASPTFGWSGELFPMCLPSFSGGFGILIVSHAAHRGRPAGAGHGLRGGLPHLWLVG